MSNVRSSKRRRSFWRPNLALRPSSDPSTTSCSHKSSNTHLIPQWTSKKWYKTTTSLLLCRAWNTWLPMDTTPCTTSSNTSCHLACPPNNQCNSPGLYLLRRTSRWLPERASTKACLAKRRRTGTPQNLPIERQISQLLKVDKTPRSETTSELISCSTSLPPKSTKAPIEKSTLSTRERTPSRICFQSNSRHTAAGIFLPTLLWDPYLKAPNCKRTNSSRLISPIRLLLCNLQLTRRRNLELLDLLWDLSL